MFSNKMHTTTTNINFRNLVHTSAQSELRLNHTTDLMKDESWACEIKAQNQLFALFITRLLV